MIIPTHSSKIIRTSKLTRFGQYAKASFTSFIFIYWADITGCDSKEVAQAEPPPAKVSVLSIQPQSVDFSENLPARVHAFRTAEIRPQVGGIIEKVLFKQGSEVRAGQALYKINSETFDRCK